MLLISAYAISSHIWDAPVTVAVKSNIPYIKVYLEGQEVTSITLDLVPGSYVALSLAIENTHPNATFILNYNSTLAEVTDKIWDKWSGTWPMRIYPGQKIYTTYYVKVYSDCPLGTYSWTIYLYSTF